MCKVVPYSSTESIFNALYVLNFMSISLIALPIVMQHYGGSSAGWSRSNTVVLAVHIPPLLYPPDTYQAPSYIQYLLVNLKVKVRHANQTVRVLHQQQNYIFHGATLI